MAYALVGSAGTVAQGTTNVTPAFGQSTTAGNLLIAGVTSTSGVAGDIATTASGWAQAVQGGSSNDSAAIFYKKNCGAGETAPQFTTASGATITAVLAEFSGGDTTAPLDQSGSHLDNTSSGTNIIACSVADAGSGELIITAHNQPLTKAGTNTTTNTYNNGATATSLGQNDSTSTANHYDFAYGITTGNSAADQDTHTSSSMNINAGMGALASFKVAAAAAATSLPPLPFARRPIMRTLLTR